MLAQPGTNVIPVPAATVVMIRDAEHGLETWMMRRVRAMAFAPGAVVFPGGRVDPRDADVTVPWLGCDPETVATRLGTDPRSARELVTAAVRELFEEASVLLADPLPAGRDLALARAAIESRDLTLAQFLADSGSALRADALHAWARWVTPPVERRRYDTWFFVTSLPAGVDATAAGSEADQSGWIAVSEVLSAYAAGQMHVLPPTVTMLRGLAAEGSVAAVLGAAPQRALEPVHPQITVAPDGSIKLEAAGATFQFPAPAGGPVAPA